MTCDLTFRRKIEALPGGEQLGSCFLCGTCSAGCPVSNLDADYSPRNIMRQVLLGDAQALLTGREIWKCIQCQACIARCPQDARPADVIEALREYAVSEGKASRELYDGVNAIDDEMKILQQEKVKALLDQAGLD